ncbi:hypothetical protein KVR01_002851 [Diaporthe batatas]|uniref:uncharacterized protein n=1 Tax=Diaporthe batatas TaxID=748121 RepID=UPI001D052269|nr:uncharacterized protein KVR01_002851 [Diaporthe batatas]KAG8167162.1 hypothetical protein KVR01_002851 [Diaporthe batatas]
MSKYHITFLELSANNAPVKAEIEHIFNLLAKWCGDKPCVDLEISDVYSPAGDADQCSEPDHRFSLLNLVNKGSSLPPLPCVRSFVIRHGSSTPWHPAAVAALTSRMTRAERVEWQLGWNEARLWGRYYAMDLQWREALVRAVLEEEPSDATTAIAAPSVTDFGCAVMSPQAGENESLPDLLRASGGRDLVGQAVQRLSRGCERLDYEGPVHASFFDPAQAAPGAWERLRVMNIKLDMRGPHGRWYFGFGGGAHDSDGPLAEISIQMPPGYGATEQELEDALVFYEDHMGQDQDDDDGDVRPPRDTPAGAELNPLLASFARACARLPSLEVASLEAEYRNDENWPFVLTVAAPGKILGGDWGERFARGDGTWRWYLHAEGQWRPDRETMEVLESFGRDAAHRAGTDETVVAFLPWGTF